VSADLDIAWFASSERWLLPLYAGCTYPAQSTSVCIDSRAKRWACAPGGGSDMIAVAIIVGMCIADDARRCTGAGEQEEVNVTL